MPVSRRSMSADEHRRWLGRHVNLEIGNATVGSVACCATKESSFVDGTARWRRT
jgi:hypothetical protein